jgi:hypothetical protein
MNRLPRVLQNEIWEYVRGDRAFWRNLHEDVMTELDAVHDFQFYYRCVDPTNRKGTWQACIREVTRFERVRPSRDRVREFRRYLSSLDMLIVPENYTEWRKLHDIWEDWKEGHPQS